MALCVECGTLSDVRAPGEPTVARAMEGKFLSVTSTKKRTRVGVFCSFQILVTWQQFLSVGSKAQIERKSQLSQENFAPKTKNDKPLAIIDEEEETKELKN